MSYESSTDSQIPADEWSAEAEIDRSSGDERASAPPIGIGTALSVLWFVESEPERG